MPEVAKEPGSILPAGAVARRPQLSPAPSPPPSRQKPTLSWPRPQKSGLLLLAPEELAEWDALVDRAPQRSVFLKSWWLRAACGQARVLGYFESGQLKAGIPLHYERRCGMRLCLMPKLTQTMGVAIEPLPGKNVAQLTRETEILDRFAERLASEQVFLQAFHPNSQNWLPFYWRGYTQTTHYTYVLEDLSSLDRIWNEMESVRRTNVRKARGLGLKVKECGVEEVYNAASATFHHQGRKTPYTLEHLGRLYDAAQANRAGICMAAADGNGKVHAAAFFVWDEQRGYHLAGGHDPALTSSGGAVLLVWNLIEFASRRTRIFDFEGSMRKPVESSFRSFGSRRVAYNRIVKMPRWLRIALCAAGRVLP